MLKKEIWKDIPNYVGSYMVSNLARVKSLDRLVDRRKGTKRFAPGKILSPSVDPSGYKSVKLSSISYKVHRLVAICFVPNPNNYPQINHKDGIKSNNIYTNLEWCTASQNAKHFINNGLRNSTKHSKSIEQYSLEKELINIFESLSEAERVTGINRSTINSCIIRGTNITQGYIWKLK